jgi:Macrocin-O-methyltransferase (TylF)
MSGAPPRSLVSGEVAAAMCEKAAAAPAGCFVEVGVYLGGTAWHLAKVAREQRRNLYLYDTFEGMPYADPVAGDSHKVGDFADTSVAQVQAAIPDALVIKGVFPKLSPVYLPITVVAFAHLDCDQYQSYRDSLDYLVPRMSPGGLIWLDDYDCLVGATRAVDEHLMEGRVRLHRAEKFYLEKLRGD